jgi:hypothetical protein
MEGGFGERRRGTMKGSDAGRSLISFREKQKHVNLHDVLDSDDKV